MKAPIREDVRLGAWVAFLRAHSSVTRRLNGELIRAHDLPLNDYEALLHLALAPDKRLRRVDLAESVLLTPSGITRLLAGLERLGYVARASCPGDARVSYAVLTRAGAKKLAEAAETHLDGVRRLFTERFVESELETLARFLTRVLSEDVEPGE